jgi:NAD(P)-dependent dehydrogenase (short-subunit alcohol dehydrogenase family)
MSEHKAFDKNFMIKDMVAIVTGGASGIGKATASLFAEKGAKVILFDRSDDVKEVACEISQGASGVKLDITDMKQIDNAVTEVKEEFGAINILCNIAGLGSASWANEITQEEWNRILSVNLTALFFMSQRVGREMIAAGKGGKIINMASQAGIVAIDGHVAYSASKAGVLAVTRALALEWGKYNITVNAISPTVILTPMSAEYWSGTRGEAHLSLIPAGRFGYPDEVAACALFLASDAANLVNGANLVIDGGFSIR